MDQEICSTSYWEWCINVVLLQVFVVKNQFFSNLLQMFTFIKKKKQKLQQCQVTIKISKCYAQFL